VVSGSAGHHKAEVYDVVHGGFSIYGTSTLSHVNYNKSKSIWWMLSCNGDMLACHLTIFVTFSYKNKII
jgi:hypothetical protein